jgi:hypothetical protein
MTMLLALLATALIPGSSVSTPPPPILGESQFGYTYVELNYLLTDSDAADDTLGGLELVGSLELPLHFFGQAGISRQSDDADLDQFRLGVGYYLPVAEQFDVYGLLSYARFEVDDSGADFDDDGTAAEIGARTLISPKFELNGAGKWTNLDDDEVGLGLGARYYMTEALSLGGRLETIDDEDTVAVGVRYQLGTRRD